VLQVEVDSVMGTEVPGSARLVLIPGSTNKALTSLLS
jgi:hypothetical protein